MKNLFYRRINVVNEIHKITARAANSYLVGTDVGFVLIDTGYAGNREKVRRELTRAGCAAGNLKLIVITHGDLDHTGNCAYIKEEFGARIAMHRDDSGMAERCDMSVNRKPKPDRMAAVFKLMVIFDMSKRFDAFTPDVYLEDEQHLSEHGIDAKIVSIPGHSKGSIGILTSTGDFFCGDLLMNFRKPRLHFLIDDMETAEKSVERMTRLNIKRVFPGHGRPFPIEALSIRS